MSAKIGDVIKSYDFPNTKTCYMVGKVVDMVGDYLVCETIKQVFNDENVDDYSPEFRTPQIGCMMFDDKYPRIEVIA